MEMPLLTMCVWAKLRVRALDERWLGCLFLSLSDCCLKLPRRHRLYKMDLELGGMAASDSFLQPDRKITRLKRGKRIQHNVHRIGVAGEI